MHGFCRPASRLESRRTPRRLLGDGLFSCPRKGASNQGPTPSRCTYYVLRGMVRNPSSSNLDGRISSVRRILSRMVSMMVRKQLVFAGTKEKTKRMGPKPRFILSTTESIPDTKVDKWGEAQRLCYIEEGESIEKKVEDASMHRLRKVVPAAERSGGAHE